VSALTPSECEDDPGVALVFDTLCQRGHDPDLVRGALDVYEGNLWLDIFGPAVDRAAEAIGLRPYPLAEE